MTGERRRGRKAKEVEEIMKFFTITKHEREMDIRENKDRGRSR